MYTEGSSSRGNGDSRRVPFPALSSFQDQRTKVSSDDDSNSNLTLPSASTPLGLGMSQHSDSSQQQPRQQSRSHSSAEQRSMVFKNPMKPPMFTPGQLINASTGLFGNSCMQSLVSQDRAAYEELVRRVTSETGPAASPIRTDMSINMSVPSALSSSNVVADATSVIDVELMADDNKASSNNRPVLLERQESSSDDFFTSLLDQMKTMTLQTASDVKRQEALQATQKRKIIASPEEFERVLRARLGLEPPRPVFRRLGPEELVDVRRILGPGSESELVSPPPCPATGNLSVTRRDVRTLLAINWLNDEVINMYMALITLMTSADSKTPILSSVSSYAFNTYFMSTLQSKGYTGVRRWTRKVDIFSYDLLLIPIHVRVHWILGVVDVKRKTVILFDSLGANHASTYGRSIVQYLQSEHADKFAKQFAFDAAEWKVVDRKDAPQQTNGGDCGVFTCQFARCCAQLLRTSPMGVQDVQFDFLPSDMPDARQRMAFELAQARILS